MRGELSGMQVRLAGIRVLIGPAADRDHSGDPLPLKIIPMELLISTRLKSFHCYSFRNGFLFLKKSMVQW